MIYSSNQVIYIGKAKVLYRRINSDHISGENKITTSTFRRSLCQKFNRDPGPWMRKWILDDCKFKYVEISNSDLCDLVESFLINLLRREGGPLLNK